MQRTLVTGIETFRHSRVCRPDWFSISCSLHTCTATSTRTQEDAGAGKWRSAIYDILPRSRFRSFTTPLLLPLRLFYQAKSFDDFYSPTNISTAPSFLQAVDHIASTPFNLSPPSDDFISLGQEIKADISSKLPIGVWCSMLQHKHHIVHPSSTLRSMT